MALQFDTTGSLTGITKNSIVPKGLQSLNPKIIATLRNMMLQQKSRFDFLLFRTPFNQSSNTTASSSTAQIAQATASAVGGVAGLGIDLLMAKVYVQKITIPTMKVMYERINGEQYTKDLEYPETVQISFIDDERGLVMRYLQDWYNDVMVPVSNFSTKPGYVFRDNQENARRTGILQLQNIAGSVPPTYPLITYYGLVPKDIADITVGQEEKDNIIYDVNFAVREVRVARFV